MSEAPFKINLISISILLTSKNKQCGRLLESSPDKNDSYYDIVVNNWWWGKRDYNLMLLHQPSAGEC